MQEDRGIWPSIRRLRLGPGFSLIPCATQIQPHSPAQTSLPGQECAGHRATRIHTHRLLTRGGPTASSVLGGAVKATDSGTKRPWFESKL